jgi:hypothetical protein
MADFSGSFILQTNTSAVGVAQYSPKNTRSVITYHLCLKGTNYAGEEGILGIRTGVSGGPIWNTMSFYLQPITTAYLGCWLILVSLARLADGSSRSHP